MITYKNNVGQITFCADDISQPYLYDPAKFVPNQKIGRYDTYQVPALDGVTTYGASISNTQIRLEGRVLLYNIRPVLPVMEQYYSTRQKLCDLFCPKFKGILTYTTRAGAYRIRDVYPVAPPTFGDYVTGTMPITIELASDMAYWEETQPHCVEMGIVHGRLTLPCTLPVSFGLYKHRTAEINNGSPYNIYPTVTLNARNTFTRLVNKTTGKLISMTRTIDAGQKIVIDTSPRVMRATIYGQKDGEWIAIGDASPYISLDSMDFALIPGKNTLALENDVADGTPSVIVEYRRAVLGV